MSLFPVCAPSFIPAASGDQGTWSQSSSGDGTHQNTYDFCGLYFVPNGNGTIATVKVNCSWTHAQTGSGQVMMLYTDNSGSPGTQIGVDSDVTNVNATGDFTFTFSTPPAIEYNVGVWMVCDGSADASYFYKFLNVTRQSPNISGGSTASGAVTTISADSGQWGGGTDFKMEILPS